MNRRTLLRSAAALGVAAAVFPARAAAADVARVLFVGAHPDDETIGMGVSLAEHVAAGLDVHLLLLSDGEGSTVLDGLNGVTVNSWWGVRHDPAAEGYLPLSGDDLAAARVREAANAVRALSLSLGTVTIHRAHLPDGHITAEAAQAAILAVADEISPDGPVRLKGHTYVSALDTHPDHIAAGTALHNLKAADPFRFGDVRYYVLPGYWGLTTALATVTRFWDTPTDVGIAARARNATRCYGAWVPDAGAYAVGYHSKSDWLDVIAGTPKCLVHT